MVFYSADGSVLSKKSIVRRNRKSNNNSTNVLECSEENSSRSDFRKFMFSRFAKVFLLGSLYLFLENGIIYEDNIVSRGHWGNINARKLTEANLRGEQGENNEYMGKNYDPQDMENVEQGNYGTGNKDGPMDLYKGDSTNMWGAGGNRSVGLDEQNWDTYYKSSYGNFPPSAHSAPDANSTDALKNRSLRYGDSSMQDSMIEGVPSSLDNNPDESVFNSRPHMGDNQADSTVTAGLPGSVSMSGDASPSEGATKGTQGEEVDDDKYAVFDRLYKEYLASTKGEAGLAGAGTSGDAVLGTELDVESDDELGRGLGGRLDGRLDRGLDSRLDDGLAGALGGRLDNRPEDGLAGALGGRLDNKPEDGLAGALGGRLDNKPEDGLAGALGGRLDNRPEDGLGGALGGRLDNRSEGGLGVGLGGRLEIESDDGLGGGLGGRLEIESDDGLGGALGGRLDNRSEDGLGSGVGGRLEIESDDGLGRGLGGRLDGKLDKGLDNRSEDGLGRGLGGRLDGRLDRGLDSRLDDGLGRGLGGRLDGRLDRGLDSRLDDGLGRGLGGRLDGRLDRGLDSRLDDGLGRGLGGRLDGKLDRGLDSRLNDGLSRGLGGRLGANMGAGSENIFNRPYDPYRQFESEGPSHSMWSEFLNEYDSSNGSKIGTSVNTNDLYPGDIWAEYKQQLGNYSDTKEELEKNRHEDYSSHRSSNSYHHRRSSSERTSSSSRSKSASDSRESKYSGRKGTSNEEYDRRRKESKILEQASSKHIRGMIDKLGSTVNTRDMFYLFNCLINHERRKYIDMEEITMLFWDRTAKSYGLPDYYKNRQWMKAFDGMTKELFYTEKKLFDRLYHLLQHGSCSRSGFIQFLKEVKFTCHRMRKEMENQWKQYLSSKVRGFWQ
ncbi:Plasmodium exported protein, unknown function [Plasmodium knowlesi strain H]|uniref:Plasmodium RESA N-terminal domain-containing protein n=3 Tax=Plasmodium knowlesi TaxID=5850 RepID=A0A5K1U979_PLAKH|nr:Plasmodium exported protein (PHIST), unknown function [Plasmodium knowlesi strain H]OTN66903.1 Uncharacterized protein PKNOH_S07438300 [Plasmodium knowlesi]CAA9988518.1 Plasmodium exported protein (PHIST), unknown function [Plasmodium knowlesi strain H]SBO21284.1 Plasmodium exported protein, unknown function [Plasmodium knowlesi strain H]SBO21738.1 Plasmodium exported protein, unknown function [Plasmodium knowlesi strain H]VVS77992.1 Plasmodium exported protein (PHIST), unknown function [Pl|eukprot:XP_002259493.1 hypothetical protein, conserved in Plasmodium species [Plasmodium knowlesi strain H]